MPRASLRSFLLRKPALSAAAALSASAADAELLGEPAKDPGQLTTLRCGISARTRSTIAHRTSRCFPLNSCLTAKAGHVAVSRCDCFKQLAAIAHRGDADFPEILRGQHG